MGATVSDPQYDTEFWFDATVYTVLDWKGYFASERVARKAFDAWLNSIRAEAWEEGELSGRHNYPVLDDENLMLNPYREGAE